MPVFGMFFFIYTIPDIGELSPVIIKIRRCTLRKHKKAFITAALICATISFAMSVPAAASEAPGSSHNYQFNSGPDTTATFGSPTMTDVPGSNPMLDNIRRNKDVAYLPPSYGIFGGDLPTNPSSLYHSADSAASATAFALNGTASANYYEETTLDSVSEEMELIVEVRPNVKNATIPKVRLDVKDLSLKNQQYRGLELLGRITNTTSETQNMTYISVVLFGENDTPMGHMFEIIMDDIPAGQERGFTVTSFNLPPDITSESVSRYEVVAYPLQFQF